MMTNIDFIGKRKIAIVFSLSLIILSAFFIFVFKGLNYGVDFTGGALVQIKFKQKITVFDLEKMRSSFKKENLNVDIQYLGETKDELMIKTRLAKEGDVSQTIEKIIKRDFKDFEVSRSEMVGPTIGKELKKLALLSVVIANIGILLYLSFRFEYRFAIGAVVALVHDVFITTGILSMVNYEFNSSIIAALLTIGGYSVNDTVVIFDRIRENMKTMKKISFLEIVNKSINQTLSRTLLTSLTVFFATVSLFVFGGEVIHGFAFVFLVGIIIGTYSTIYIASAFVVQWHLYDEKKKKQELQIPKYRR
ncbi:MAG: protein translocase subunit SecF [bacterium]